MCTVVCSCTGKLSRMAVSAVYSTWPWTTAAEDGGSSGATELMQPANRTAGRRARRARRAADLVMLVRRRRHPPCDSPPDQLRHRGVLVLAQRREPDRRAHQRDDRRHDEAGADAEHERGRLG